MVHNAVASALIDEVLAYSSLVMLLGVGCFTYVVGEEGIALWSWSWIGLVFGKY